jgi:hypothetical protein
LHPYIVTPITIIEKTIMIPIQSFQFAPLSELLCGTAVDEGVGVCVGRANPSTDVVELLANDGLPKIVTNG